MGAYITYLLTYQKIENIDFPNAAHLNTLFPLFANCCARSSTLQAKSESETIWSKDRKNRSFPSNLFRYSYAINFWTYEVEFSHLKSAVCSDQLLDLKSRI